MAVIFLREKVFLLPEELYERRKRIRPTRDSACVSGTGANLAKITCVAALCNTVNSA